MTNVATTVEANEVVVYGRIELKAVSVAEKVKELIVDGNAEFTLYNTCTPLNMFHEDNTHVAFNSITVVVDGREQVIPIGAYDIEIDYVKEEDKFVAHFSTNININLNTLNNIEIKPLEVMVTGWDYNTSDTEQFIDVSIETSLVDVEFVEEY